MRKVRPGEIPAPLSVWRWRESPIAYLVLGIAQWSDNMYHLHGINLSTGRVSTDCGIWTSKAFVGMGSVLDGWVCVEESPLA